MCCLVIWEPCEALSTLYTVQGRMIKNHRENPPKGAKVRKLSVVNS